MKSVFLFRSKYLLGLPSNKRDFCNFYCEIDLLRPKCCRLFHGGFRVIYYLKF
jgi:hypothetical protein